MQQATTKQPQKFSGKQKSWLIHGPKACGKTRNARALADALKLNHILDDWEPGQPAPAMDTLVLTNHEGPFLPFGRRILPYAEAVYLAGN